MSMKLRTKIDLDHGARPGTRLVYRTEAVDDSGQPSMTGPWRQMPVDEIVDHYIERGIRVVVEQYDRDRHGVVV